jgi:phage tail-like protein
VRRVRLDMPRATSLDRLPEVYRDDPTAADFGERFLALFDAQIEALDRAIERLPALLDVGGVPDEVLPWLASLLGESLDPAWAAERRRALLAAAPELHRERGTVAGLRRVITLALGVEPVIEELAAARAYGSVGRDARLGSVRLHGRSRARFRVGRSPLGRAPLRSYGDPDDDVAREAAYRLRVRVPPIPGMTRAQAEARLRRLVEAQKPAHVVAATAVGAGGGVLGAGLVVGVDTVIGPPAAPVLGRAGNIRLSRASVLWRARREV